MRNNEEVSDEDQDEITTFVQLARINGGNNLIDSVVNDSINNAEAHVVDATIDLRNKEAYNQILNNETNN